MVSGRMIYDCRWQISSHNLTADCCIQRQKKTAHSNLTTGRVATPRGRPTHSRRAQSFNRIYQMTPISPSNTVLPITTPTQTVFRSPQLCPTYDLNHKPYLNVCLKISTASAVRFSEYLESINLITIFPRITLNYTNIFGIWTDVGVRSLNVRKYFVQVLPFKYDTHYQAVTPADRSRTEQFFAKLNKL